MTLSVKKSPQMKILAQKMIVTNHATSPAYVLTQKMILIMQLQHSHLENDTNHATSLVNIFTWKMTTHATLLLK